MTYPSPPLKVSFTEQLVRANHLHERGFRCWYFQAGMLFAAGNTWWSAAAARPRPHEGLDLCTFLDASNRVGCLEPGTKIPVLFAGQVMAIFDDYLGQSILVAHDLRQGEERLHSIYAHLMADPGVGIGHHCHGGEIIGRIAPSRKAGLPSHLHLSTLWHSGMIQGEVSWPAINASATIRLCNPMDFIHGGDSNRGDEVTRGAHQ